MINDQWASIKNETTCKIFVLAIDFKTRKFTEKRYYSEILTEIYGDTFGINWLLPINSGGYYKFFNKIKAGIYTYEQDKKNK